MNKRLAHLQLRKQLKLRHIVDLVRSSFENATATRRAVEGWAV